MLKAIDILGESAYEDGRSKYARLSKDPLAAKIDETTEGVSSATVDINKAGQDGINSSRGFESASVSNNKQDSPDITRACTDSKEISDTPKQPYDGDYVDKSSPMSGDYDVLKFPNPAVMFAFYNDDILNGSISFHKWQAEDLEMLGNAKPSALKPFKYCLRACNGSGKDSFIVAAFAAFVCLTQKRFRVIVTSSSGVQLTAQTESPLVDFCQRVNKKHGCEIFRIRQRYIKCVLSGSEIRLFATDEKGRAEGYHPIVPNAGMAIIVSEGKTVTDEIHNALRRCTGYNYWLEVSTPGEPKGFFYRAATTWQHTRGVTTYDCSHLSLDELEEDKKEWGEHSALFRSKHLALFTSLGGETVISNELVEYMFKNPPEYQFLEWEARVGLDLAAGGDENALCICKGNRVVKEIYFREIDTTITSERIDHELRSNNIPKTSKHIYADDGGVGHSIIDQLVRMGWNINRVLNQWAAGNKRQFGNKGAENWFRCKRIFEECLFDITELSLKTREQISSRHYKQQMTGGRIFLEPKKEAIAEGRLSPDRADAFVLSLCGLNIDDFLKATRTNVPHKTATLKLKSQEEIYEHYETNVTFSQFDHKDRIIGRRVYNSLANALRRN